MTEAARVKIPSFQKILNDCAGGDFANHATKDPITSIKKLYEVIEQNFALQSVNIEERETTFTQAGQSKKLKFENNKWTLLKVLDDGTHQTLASGARQKVPTIESVLSDLLINSKIESDLTKINEIRAGERNLLIKRANAEIRYLQYRKAKAETTLECSRSDKADICSCN